MNVVTNKPIEVIEMTRFKDPSADWKMANVLLVLSGSAVGGSNGWSDCAAPAALGPEAAGISELLGRVVTDWAWSTERTDALEQNPEFEVSWGY